MSIVIIKSQSHSSTPHVLWRICLRMIRNLLAFIQPSILTKLPDNDAGRCCHHDAATPFLFVFHVLSENHCPVFISQKVFFPAVLLLLFQYSAFRYHRLAHNLLLFCHSVVKKTWFMDCCRHFS